MTGKIIYAIVIIACVVWALINIAKYVDSEKIKSYSNGYDAGVSAQKSATQAYCADSIKLDYGKIEEIRFERAK